MRQGRALPSYAPGPKPKDAPAVAAAPEAAEVAPPAEPVAFVPEVEIAAMIDARDPQRSVEVRGALVKYSAAEVNRRGRVTAPARFWVLRPNGSASCSIPATYAPARLLTLILEDLADIVPEVVADGVAPEVVAGHTRAGVHGSDRAHAPGQAGACGGQARAGARGRGTDQADPAGSTAATDPPAAARMPGKIRDTTDTGENQSTTSTGEHTMSIVSDTTKALEAHAFTAPDKTLSLQTMIIRDIRELRRDNLTLNDARVLVNDLRFLADALDAGWREGAAVHGIDTDEV